MSDDIRVDLVFDLIHSFKNLNDAGKIADFLEDLLTPTEVRNLSVRLRIAKMILAGKSQRDISVALHTSLATTNKVHGWLFKSGKGFREAMAKLPVKWDKPSKMPNGPIEFHLPDLLRVTTEGLISTVQEKAPTRLLKNISTK